MSPDESLRFHPDVTLDLREALGWYSDISEDLANRFRAMVNASLDDVAGNPVLYPVVFDEVRFVRVQVPLFGSIPRGKRYSLHPWHFPQRKQPRQMASTGSHVSRSTNIY